MSSHQDARKNADSVEDEAAARDSRKKGTVDESEDNGEEKEDEAFEGDTRNYVWLHSDGTCSLENDPPRKAGYDVILEKGGPENVERAINEQVTGIPQTPFVAGRNFKNYEEFVVFQNAENEGKISPERLDRFQYIDQDVSSRAHRYQVKYERTWLLDSGSRTLCHRSSWPTLAQAALAAQQAETAFASVLGESKLETDCYRCVHVDSDTQGRKAYFGQLDMEAKWVKGKRIEPFAGDTKSGLFLTAAQAARWVDNAIMYHLGIEQENMYSGIHGNHTYFNFRNEAAYEKAHNDERARRQLLGLAVPLDYRSNHFYGMLIDRGRNRNPQDET